MTVKKRILQVSVDGLGNGGTQNVIMGIVRNLSSEFDFDILLFTNEIRHYDEEFLRYGRIFRIPKYERKNKLIKKIEHIIVSIKILICTYLILKRNGPYHAIHCHNELESGWCNLAAFFAGVKLRISHSHTNIQRFNKKNIIKYMYNKYLQVITNLSSNIKIGCTTESFISVFGEKYLNKKESRIIYNSIDLSRFRRIKYLNNNKQIIIVNVGSFSENKNQLFIIEMLPFIINEIPNINLKLVGFGEKYKQKLTKRVKDLRLETYVEFLPPNTNIPKLLNKANLFIFPSKREGFGIALLEAQAMEVPCLVSDTVPKIVDVGMSKFLSLSEGKEVWAKKAVEILRGNHNLELDRDKLRKFDLKQYINEIKNVYLSK